MKKVIVAISGGVDSSVADALLKKQGFEVEAAFMRLFNLASSKEAEIRAKKIAKSLKIPIYIWDFRKKFRKRIINCFLENYKRGVTPNPCVNCNKEIKFGLFLDKALKLKADFIATGHYARLRREFPISNFQFPKYKLLKGKDKNKDQSYFLWRLNQKQLKHILFPLGDYKKDEVRKIAKKLKLPSLKAPESQEICFVPGEINDFLKKYLKTKPGKVIDVKGKILGKHQGLHFYTIGQRKGINLSALSVGALAKAGQPFYVLNKDLENNKLVVTQDEKELYKKELIVKNLNWISGEKQKLPLKVKAKIRYRHKPAQATINKIPNSKFHILEFNKAQRAITPGQSVVIYKGNELLGGGIIC